MERADLRRQRKAERAERLLLDAGLRHIMEDRDARRWLWHILGASGLFQNPFAAGPQTDFRCGMMNVGQIILAEITTVAPEGYVQMIKESLDVERERAAAGSTAGGTGPGGDPDQSELQFYD